MSEKNKEDEKFDFSYMIHIKSEGFPKKIIELLQKNNIKFGVWYFDNQLLGNNTLEEDNKEDAITISIPKELYNAIEVLCKINNLDTNDKINDILESAVVSAEINEEDGSKHVFNF